MGAIDSACMSLGTVLAPEDGERLLARRNVDARQRSEESGNARGVAPTAHVPSSPAG
jgi:hypothetical protein